jgi:hypothetical protein
MCTTNISRLFPIHKNTCPGTGDKDETFEYRDCAGAGAETLIAACSLHGAYARDRYGLER